MQVGSKSGRIWICSTRARRQGGHRGSTTQSSRRFASKRVSKKGAAETQHASVDAAQDPALSVHLYRKSQTGEGGKTDRKVSLHRDDPDNPIRFAEVNDTCHKALPQWVKCLDEKGKRGNRDARQSGQGKVPSGSGLMRNPSPKAEACGALQGRKKAAPSCESAAFRIRGSPSWARTSDLRINSPSLYRLSYRGVL